MLRSTPSNKRFSLAEHDRRNGKVQFVGCDQLEELSHRRDPASDLHVLVRSRGPCAFERRINAVGHEVKGGASLHRDRCSGMMGEHERGAWYRGFGPHHPVDCWFGIGALVRGSRAPSNASASEPVELPTSRRFCHRGGCCQLELVQPICAPPIKNPPR